MHVCPSCRRHVKNAETRCPFCDGPGVVGRLLAVVPLVLTPFVLAACYGMPQCDEDKTSDADADGYTACEDGAPSDDCDDTEAAVNPGATEDCGDGIDNDCDTLVDADDVDDCGGDSGDSGDSGE